MQICRLSGLRALTRMVSTNKRGGYLSNEPVVAIISDSLFLYRMRKPSLRLINIIWRDPWPLLISIRIPSQSHS